ncbi:restriction endonuclease subunit S [Lactococcus cremoris]
MVGTMAKIDDSVKKKVPELRFKGFTDDWEERKLGELSQDTFGGGTPKTSVTEYWNGEIPWIQSSDLSSDHLFGVLPKKHITENAVKNSATKLIPKNSIAIVTRVGVGKLAFMPYEFTSSQDFLSLSNLQVDCNFGMYSIYKMLQRELNNIQGTSIKGITKADLLDKEVIIPVEFEEQQRIGSFFKQLDDTIALHQRKLDLLKEQKKGYLQKMFPKNGAKVPELRFAGFADDWEERKLGELSQDTFGGGTPKTSVTEYWNGEIPWIQSSDLSSDHLFGVLPKKHITENAVKNSATKLIPKNSIAIVTRVGVGKLAFMPYEFTSSQDFLSLSNLQVDCNFGMYSIYKMLQRELNNIQGTSIKGITKADLLDKEVIIPVEFEEQQRIGSFFKQLDDTIALHQRKLDLLKEQKKGFLQKMFV